MLETDQGKSTMTRDARANRFQVFLWMAAGAMIAFLVVAITAVWLAPKFLGSPETDPSPPPTETPVNIAEVSAIPSFTPSLTPSPSLTLAPSLTPTPSRTPAPTETETPSVTPTITPTPPPIIRAQRDTRLYLGPATSYPEQGWLVEGQSALVISQLEGGEWWYVETERGIRGWASAETVTTENDPSTVPVVTAVSPGAYVPPPGPSKTPAPIIGPLELDEIWPVNVLQCQNYFEIEVWVRAHGGTGLYSYLVNGEVIAQDVLDDGIVVRIGTPPSAAWAGVISVISGGLQVDREMYFSPADWCDAP